MLVVKDSNIFLTRGDSASFEIDIKDADDKDFIFTQDFTLIFTVKKYCDSKFNLIQKTLSNSILLELSPEDTSNLPFGEYFYDVELRTHDKIYTVITPHKFILEAEVTY